MKGLFAVCAVGFFALLHAASALSAFANGAFCIAKLDETTSTELSIPPDIGIEIPEVQESLPIVGIIMWALAAVIVLAALIVIFTNTKSYCEQSVRRDRYYKKKAKKNGKYSKYKE